MAEIKKRTQHFRSGKSSGSSSHPIYGSFAWFPQDLSISGSQETVSENHPGWHARANALRDSTLSAPLRDLIEGQDVGANFFTKRNNYRSSHNNVTISVVDAQQWRDRYTGDLCAHVGGENIPASVWPSVPGETEIALHAAGATAIARVLPTNPAAGAATFLGELREGLPKIPGRSVFDKHRRSYRDIGGEYLNIEFGWKPMVSDVRKFAKAARDSKKITEQYMRDSGRHIRRRYDFPTLTTTTVDDMGTASPWPALPFNMYSSPYGRKLRTRVSTTKMWFSGCFSYYLHPGNSEWDKLVRHEQIANRLYGTRVNPETLWELQAWSWFADWFSNVGDVIHNFSAFSRDGLVMRWGYMMAHTIVTDTYTLEGVTFKGHDPGTFTQTFETEVKQRVKATPYGFGLNIDQLTGRQWAILVALGIAKGPRSKG